ncbi:Copalyl diphosphate synthase [Diplogelasinospora grovesii]|uniref:Copalyl diphosphate synthase n=1 Tax=Diplogelasinospora grovesii TaxID=303347 RepID=A0AAN6NER2_9PEZI|nr:Copalyl diphosphate synthase [Diplogelasinospora grovesii]
MNSSLYGQAQALLATMAAQCSAGQGLGAMSASVYDTAWLSMVQKPATSGAEAGVWLFPECFEFVLAQQLPSGAWESYATPIDGVLNTAAGLLSLKRHLQTQPDHHDWLLRSQKAEAALKQILHGWDMHSTDQVGFEILVFSLLSLLQEEGVFLSFPQLGALRNIRDAKLAKLPPSTLYQTPSTLYHSLEAFIDHIDFDRVRCWREENGSMMGSPASTAAYLMYSSIWDDEAEAYLKKVLNRANGSDRGSVPCAWPTTIFEVSWVLTTLASVGVPIGEAEKSAFGHLLRQALVAQKGLLGFAPGSFPDADDTANGLEALHYLGQSSSVEPLIQAYEASEHFITYPGERNSSFSANCNVLILLLVRADRAQYLPQIAKAVKFLTSQVFRGHVKEKWHLSELYWMMLLSRAFELLFQHDEIALGVFNLAPSLREEIPMVSLHLLLRLLCSQQWSGSWNGICEVTSYGVLTLSSLAKLPWMQQLDKGRIIAAMALAKSFLHTNRSEWVKGRYLWIEKVTYSSDVLSEAYCLAAALAPIPETIQAEPGAFMGGRAFLVPDKLLLDMRKAGNLLARTPLVSQLEPGALRAAEMQACFAMQALQRHPLEVFPRTAKGKDKYLFVIPLALTVSAALHGSSASLFVIYEMMVLSTLNFHADKYMEDVVETHVGEYLDDIRSVVRQLFTKTSSGAQNGANGHGGEKTTSHDLEPEQFLGESSNGHSMTPEMTQSQSNDTIQDQRPSIEDIKTVLDRFVAHILHHPAVLSSPASLQTRLAFDLQTFLLAHVTQAQDNHRLRAQCRGRLNGASNGNGVPNSPMQYRDPERTFYNWVRSTSADHTSCPFSFIFFNCLLHTSTQTPGVQGILASARAAYLAEDACRHLASLCRMYNDLGSVARDAEERSLNSVNFPEFFFQADTTTTTTDSAKAELLWIAEYERRGLEMAMKSLQEELMPKRGGSECMSALRLFVDLTDLYGQIYVLEDIGTRT